MRFALTAAATLLLGACAAVEPQDPIDVDRAMTTLSTLASDRFEGRLNGTAGAELARQLIEARFEEVGLDPVGGVDGYRHPFTYQRGGQLARTIEGINLMGMIEGKDDTPNGPVLVITAHYDHVGIRRGEIYNGADDNASGTAALLEIAAAFAARPPAHDVLFFATDAEELGLVGARAFLKDPAIARSRIAANLNFDMVARADKGEIYAVGTYHFPQLIPLIDAVAAQAPLVLKRGHDRPEDGDQDWTYLSDQGPFIAAGIPAIYLGVEDHADYHQPSDTADKVDPEIYSKALQTLLSVARMMDENLPRIAADPNTPK